MKCTLGRGKHGDVLRQLMRAPCASCELHRHRCAEDYQRSSQEADVMENCYSISDVCSS